jgi:hypothetical protein
MAKTSIGVGGALSLVGSLLDMGTSVYGGILNSGINKANAQLALAQGNYASSVEEYNASVARANAIAIRAVADFDIERQKKAATRFKSGQIAGYSKAGVRLEGSPVEVMIDSATQAKIDIAITDYNAKQGIATAQSRAQQFGISGQIQKSNYNTQSSIFKSASKSAIYEGIAGALSKGTSLLSLK